MTQLASMFSSYGFVIKRFVSGYLWLGFLFLLICEANRDGNAVLMVIFTMLFAGSIGLCAKIAIFVWVALSAKAWVHDTESQEGAVPSLAVAHGLRQWITFGWAVLHQLMISSLFVGVFLGYLALVGYKGWPTLGGFMLFGGILYAVTAYSERKALRAS